MVIPVSAFDSIKYLCCPHILNMRPRCHCHIRLRLTVRNIHPLLLTGFHAVNNMKKISWFPHNASQQLLIHSLLQHAYSCVHETWCLIHSLAFSLRGRAGRNQSPVIDRYGSGTLHPGQVLGDSLPLLSPAFRRSHFHRQGACMSSTTREILAMKGGTVGEKDVRQFCTKFRLSRKFRDLLHAANLRHGTDGFTSSPKEGVLRIFSP